MIIDYDSEINRLKYELIAIQNQIANLESEKKKVELQRHNKLQHYSTNTLSKTYRTATKKMLDFAHVVEHANLVLNAKSKLLESKGGSIPSICEYKTKYFSNKDDDDFEMVHAYLMEWAPVARDIWSINKKRIMELQQHIWENSREYQDMKEREESCRLKEEQEKCLEEEPSKNRVYDSDGGYWEFSWPSAVYVDKFGEI